VRGEPVSCRRIQEKLQTEPALAHSDSAEVCSKIRAIMKRTFSVGAIVLGAVLLCAAPHLVAQTDPIQAIVDQFSQQMARARPCAIQSEEQQSATSWQRSMF